MVNIVSQLIPGENQIVVFFLIAARIAAMLSMLPVFGGMNVPMRYRAGMSLIIGYMILIFVRPDSAAASGSASDILFAIGSEVLIGLALGTFVKLVIEAVGLGATMLGFQMGFSIVNVVDPLTGNQVSLIGSFQGLLAGVIFLVSGAYRVFLLGIMESFTSIPPGQMLLSSELGRYFYQAGGALFVNSVRIAAPVMICLLVTKIALGIVARTVPQMNIFIVGFPLTIALGLVFLGISMPYFFHATMAAFSESAKYFNHFLSAVSP